MGNNILAICPGTREVGIALFLNGQLVDWQLYRYTRKWSQEKLYAIIKCISDWIVLHQVDSIAVKIPNELPQSPAYIQLVGSMNVTFEKNGLHVVYYTLDQLKQALCVADNRQSLYDKMVMLYPSIAREYQKDKQNAQPIYFKIFEAIAAGHVLQKTISED